jgi:hypothetical protein
MPCTGIDLVVMITQFVMNMIAVHNNVTQNDAKVAIRAKKKHSRSLIADYQILTTR